MWTYKSANACIGCGFHSRCERALHADSRAPRNAHAVQVLMAVSSSSDAVPGRDSCDRKHVPVTPVDCEADLMIPADNHARRQ